MCKTEKMQRCIIYLNSFIFFGTVELPTQVSILLKQLYNQIGSHSERVFTDHPHLSKDELADDDVEEENPRPGPALCASLRSRNALGHFTRATMCENLQEKCRRPRPGTTLCASLHSRNALDISQQPFYAEIYR